MTQNIQPSYDQSDLSLRHILPRPTVRTFPNKKHLINGEVLLNFTFLKNLGKYKLSLTTREHHIYVVWAKDFQRMES